MPDQHSALALLLELAVQRGTLSHLLNVVLLLLRLWDSGRQEPDNRASPRGTTAPLMALLRRFQDIPSPKGKFTADSPKEEDVSPSESKDNRSNMQIVANYLLTEVI